MKNLSFLCALVLLASAMITEAFAQRPRGGGTLAQCQRLGMAVQVSAGGFTCCVNWPLRCHVSDPTCLICDTSGGLTVCGTHEGNAKEELDCLLSMPAKGTTSVVRSLQWVPRFTRRPQ